MVCTVYVMSRVAFYNNINTPPPEDLHCTSLICFYLLNAAADTLHIQVCSNLLIYLKNIQTKGEE